MAVYVVTWNLNNERANYAQARKDFIQHLERHSNIGDAGLESVRWISTNLSADQLCNDLLTKLDKSDRLFISHVVNATHQGLLNKATWDWIGSKL